MMIQEITYTQAVEFLMERHYAGRKPMISYAFGFFESDKMVAVCTFGKPASNSLCIGVCGKDVSNQVYELNRLCVDGEMSKPLSFFVSGCLKLLKPLDLIIVSYADTEMGHNGYIYQATNFIYTGKTKERTDKYTPGGKHSRHYKNSEQEQFRKVRSAKHRYVYFTNNKKIYQRLLKYKIEPYPKGENRRYILGDFIKPNLVKLNKMSVKTQKAIDNLVVKNLAPIVRHYEGFIILAQNERDFQSKVHSVHRGDTKGFYTVEREILLGKSNPISTNTKN